MNHGALLPLSGTGVVDAVVKIKVTMSLNVAGALYKSIVATLGDH